MAVKKRILLVDDDDDLREELVEQFGLYDEFDTVDVGTATAGIEAAKANSFDLILLDVDLPDMMGTDACELMRKAGVAAPVVMLTGNDGDMNEFKRLTPTQIEGAPKVRDIRLTEKETNILKYLFRAGGKPVGRDELLHEVWGYNSGVTTHTLETHVYRLRQKIELEKGVATLLVTEPGGYRLALS